MRISGLLVLITMFFFSLSACVTEPDMDEEAKLSASEYNTQLGLGYLSQGNYEIALDKLRKAIKQNPENADAHHYLAQLNHILGRTDEAQKQFELALEYADKEDLLLRNNYGVFLCDQEKYQQANAIFLEILENPLYPARGQLLENIGLCAKRQGNVKLAEDYLLKALRLIPESPKSLLAMAQLSFDNQDFAKSREYLYEYLKNARHNPESLWLGILLEHKAGNHNRVASYSILLKGKYPDSKEAALLKKMEASGTL